MTSDNLIIPLDCGPMPGRRIRTNAGQVKPRSEKSS